MQGITLSVSDFVKLRFAAQSIRLSRTKRLYTQRVGGYISSYRGRGMDFEETRIYQPGDDIRTMDWRVTARTGAPHTKIFREERERPVFIIVDLAPSMFFGTRVAFKSVIAAKLAALLAWSAEQNGDRVGGIITKGHQQIELKPRSRKHGVLRLLKVTSDLLAVDDVNSEESKHLSLSAALSKLLHVSTPGSFVAIISDFHHCDDDFSKQLKRLASINDVRLFRVFDPIEMVAPQPDQYYISDGYQISQMNLSSKKLCSEYENYFLAKLKKIQYLSRQCGVPLISIATNDDIVNTLQKSMH